MGERVRPEECQGVSGVARSQRPRNGTEKGDGSYEMDVYKVPSEGVQEGQKQDNRRTVPEGTDALNFDCG